MSRRVLIVDGYNVIGALSVLRPERLEAAREALLGRLSRYAQVRGHLVIVVFDGSSVVRTQPARHAHPGIRVLFSGADEKADPIIVCMARERRGECVVVSDDHGVRRPSEHAGAVVLHCEGFDRILARSEREPVPEPAQATTHGHRPPSAPPVAPLSQADRDAWQAFASGVTRLQDDAPPAGSVPPPTPARVVPQGSREALQPAPDPIQPDASPQDAVDPWFVPDSVIAAKDADEALPRHSDRGPSRDERRRRNILDDL